MNDKVEKVGVKRKRSGFVVARCDAYCFPCSRYRIQLVWV